MALLRYSRFIGLRFCILSSCCWLKPCLSWQQLLRDLTRSIFLCHPFWPYVHFDIDFVYGVPVFQFFTLLPPLYELILEIEREDIRGGQLLNLLHKRCHCGVPELQTCIQRCAVLFACNILGIVKMLAMAFPTV